MKERIDHELQCMEFKMNVDGFVSVKKKQRNRHKPLILIILILLLGTTAHAGYTIYNAIWVNHESLPELDPMKKTIVNKLNDYDEEDMLYRKSYDSYSGLCEELGIELLSSEMAEGNSAMLITRETDNEHWTQIKVTAYILGDVYNLKKVENMQLYTWQEGEVFSSPIDMTIDIISSDEQLEIGWEKDYLGPFEYVETYQSEKGYQVNIISSAAVRKNEKPMYKAIFVADGIRYTLSGRVEISKMKEILDSFPFKN